MSSSAFAAFIDGCGAETCEGFGGSLGAFNAFRRVRRSSWLLLSVMVAEVVEVECTDWMLGNLISRA
jgi:hypothetical protein